MRNLDATLVLVIAEAATFPHFCPILVTHGYQRGPGFYSFHIALFLNDEFTFTAFRNYKQLLSFYGPPIFDKHTSLVFRTHFGRVHPSRSFESMNSAEHCCIDSSVTTNFFFIQFVYLLPLLSSYIVAALQREYEIFIRASCVEGTTSTW